MLGANMSAEFPETGLGLALLTLVQSRFRGKKHALILARKFETERM